MSDALNTTRAVLPTRASPWSEPYPLIRTNIWPEFIWVWSARAGVIPLTEQTTSKPE